jgi:hypothetical protein
LWQRASAMTTFDVNKMGDDDDDDDDDGAARDRLLRALVSAVTRAWDAKAEIGSADSKSDEEIGGPASGSRRHNHTDVGSTEQQLESRQLQAELLFHARRLCPGRRRDVPEDGGDDDELGLFDLVQTAVGIARKQALHKDAEDNEGGANSHAKKLKANATSESAAAPPPAVTSFSLLDQFNARLLGGGMGLVTVEQILEAETLSEKLDLLEQIQSLDEDDWLQGTAMDGGGETDTGDWGQVLGVIRQGLTASSEQPSGHGGVGVATGYVKLVEKWIGMAGNGGSGFGGAGTIGALQLDVVQLVVGAMVTRSKGAQNQDSPSSRRTSEGDAVSVSDSASERLTLTALMRCFWTTWMDWMMHSESRIGAANEDRVRAIGVQVWNASAPPNDTQPSLLLAVLSAVDPCARWFSSWMSLRSGYPDRDALYTMAGSTFGNGDGNVANTKGVSPLSRAWRHLARLEPDLAAGEGDALLVCCYWLSIVHSLLVHLRVSQFPWESLTAQGPDGDAAAPADDSKEGAKIVSLMNLYLKVLSSIHLPLPRGRADVSDDGEIRSQDSTLNDKSSWKLQMQAISLDAIDILLSGCRGRGCYGNVSQSVHGAAAVAEAHPKLKVVATKYLQ